MCVCVCVCVWWYCIGLWKKYRAQKSDRVHEGESVIFKYDYKKGLIYVVF